MFINYFNLLITMDTKDKTIIGLVVLLVIAVLLASGILTTGKAIKISCSDTDGGSIFEKGTISGTTEGGDTFEVTDYCAVDGSNTVKEYYCDLSQYSGHKSELVYCEKGCSGGACI